MRSPPPSPGCGALWDVRRYTRAAPAAVSSCSVAVDAGRALLGTDLIVWTVKGGATAAVMEFEPASEDLPHAGRTTPPVERRRSLVVTARSGRRRSASAMPLCDAKPTP